MGWKTGFCKSDDRPMDFDDKEGKITKVYQGKTSSDLIHGD